MFHKSKIIAATLTFSLLASWSIFWNKDTVKSGDLIRLTQAHQDLYSEQSSFQEISEIKDLITISTLETSPSLFFQELRKIYNQIQNCNSQDTFTLRLDTGENLLVKDEIALLSFPKEDNNYGYIYVLDIESDNIKSIIKGRVLNPVKQGMSLEPSIRSGWLGYSISHYENYILIGSPTYFDLEYRSSGAVSLFDLSKNEEVYRFKNSGNISQRFGSLVKINEDYVVIYAMKDDPFKSKASVSTYSLKTKEKIFEVNVSDLSTIDVYDNKVVIVDRTASNSFHKKIRSLFDSAQENQQLIQIFTLKEEKVDSVDKIAVESDNDVFVENGYLVFTPVDHSVSTENLVGFAIDIRSREKLYNLYSSSQKVSKDSQFNFCLPAGMIEIRNNN